MCSAGQNTENSLQMKSHTNKSKGSELMNPSAVNERLLQMQAQAEKEQDLLMLLGAELLKIVKDANNKDKLLEEQLDTILKLAKELYTTKQALASLKKDDVTEKTKSSFFCTQRF